MVMLEVSIATIRQIPDESLLKLRGGLQVLSMYPSFQKWLVEWIDSEINCRFDDSIERSMLLIPWLPGDELSQWLRGLFILQKHVDETVGKLISELFERVIVQATIRLARKDSIDGSQV